MKPLIDENFVQWRWHDAVRIDLRLFVILLMVGCLIVVLGLFIRIYLKSRGIRFHQPTKIGESFCEWKKPSGHRTRIDL